MSCKKNIETIAKINTSFITKEDGKKVGMFQKQINYSFEDLFNLFDFSIISAYENPAVSKPISYKLQEEKNK